MNLQRGNSANHSSTVLPPKSRCYQTAEPKLHVILSCFLLIFYKSLYFSWYIWMCILLIIFSKTQHVLWNPYSSDSINPWKFELYWFINKDLLVILCHLGKYMKSCQILNFRFCIIWTKCCNLIRVHQFIYLVYLLSIIYLFVYCMQLKLFHVSDTRCMSARLSIIQSVGRQCLHSYNFAQLPVLWQSWLCLN